MIARFTGAVKPGRRFMHLEFVTAVVGQVTRNANDSSSFSAIICIGINRGVPFFFFFTDCTVVQRKNETPLFISIQIIVEK